MFNGYIKALKLVSEYSEDDAGVVLNADEYLVSANSLFVLAVPKNIFGDAIFINFRDDEKPDLSFILNTKNESTIKVDVSYLKTLFDNIPKKSGLVQCTNCLGWGNRKCDSCGTYLNCPSCDGTGFGFEKDENVMDLDYHFTFGENFINIFLIDILLRVSDLIGLNNNLEIVSNEKNKPIIIKCGNIYMAVAPTAADVGDKLIKVF